MKTFWIVATLSGVSFGVPVGPGIDFSIAPPRTSTQDYIRIPRENPRFPLRADIPLVNFGRERKGFVPPSAFPKKKATHAVDGPTAAIRSEKDQKGNVIGKMNGYFPHRIADKAVHMPIHSSRIAPPVGIFAASEAERFSFTPVIKDAKATRTQKESKATTTIKTTSMAKQTKVPVVKEPKPQIVNAESTVKPTETKQAKSFFASLSKPFWSDKAGKTSKIPQRQTTSENDEELIRSAQQMSHNLEEDISELRKSMEAIETRLSHAKKEQENQQQQVDFDIHYPDLQPWDHYYQVMSAKATATPKPDDRFGPVVSLSTKETKFKKNAKKKTPKPLDIPKDIDEDKTLTLSSPVDNVLEDAKIPMKPNEFMKLLSEGKFSDIAKVTNPAKSARRASRKVADDSDIMNPELEKVVKDLDFKEKTTVRQSIRDKTTDQQDQKMAPTPTEVPKAIAEPLSAQSLDQLRKKDDGKSDALRLWLESVEPVPQVMEDVKLVMKEKPPFTWKSIKKFFTSPAKPKAEIEVKKPSSGGFFDRWFPSMFSTSRENHKSSNAEIKEEKENKNRKSRIVSEESNDVIFAKGMKTKLAGIRSTSKQYRDNANSLSAHQSNEKDLNDIFAALDSLDRVVQMLDKDLSDPERFAVHILSKKSGHEKVRAKQKTFKMMSVILSLARNSLESIKNPNLPNSDIERFIKELVESTKSLNDYTVPEWIKFVGH